MVCDSNRVGNGGCDTLATLLRDPNCNLHTLYLAGNVIDNEGAIALTNSLANNTKLKVLNLARNSIGDDGSEALAALLEDTGCNLQRLDLTNNRINNEGATTLANSLSNNTKMKELYLGVTPNGCTRA